MRYRLRTLLIAMAVGPPVLAGAAWVSVRPEYACVAAFVAWSLTATVLPLLIVTEFVKGAWPE